MTKLRKQPPLWSLLTAIAAAALTGFATTDGVRAQQLETVSAIWCDKAEQLEGVLRAHANDRITLRAAMARINTEAQDPGACIMAAAIVKETTEIRRLVIGNEMISIRQYQVVGVLRHGLPLRIEQQVWYAAKVLAELKTL